MTQRVRITHALSSHQVTGSINQALIGRVGAVRWHAHSSGGDSHVA